MAEFGASVNMPPLPPLESVQSSELFPSSLSASVEIMEIALEIGCRTYRPIVKYDWIPFTASVGLISYIYFSFLSFFLFPSSGRPTVSFEPLTPHILAASRMQNRCFCNHLGKCINAEAGYECKMYEECWRGTNEVSWRREWFYYGPSLERVGRRWESGRP